MGPDSATRAAIDAVLTHHPQMERELHRRVADLLAAVSVGLPSASLSSAVIDYIRDTILPHAAPERVTLHAAAARRRTVQGRSARPCAVVRRRVQRSSVWRSSGVNANGTLGRPRVGCMQEPSG